MKNALFLDTVREIKHSLSRLLSIFTIIALGCGFFAGIKVTMPDMIDTATEYFIDNKLMDYKIMSSIGIKSENVQAVRKVDGVKGAAPAYSKDVFYRYNNQNIVLKVMSFNTNKDMEDENFLNKPVLLEGRLPQKSGECVVETKSTSPDTFKVGNELQIFSPTQDEDILDSFAVDTFEIVGIVTSPVYIGFERDATDVGNGSVQSYIMVPEDDFALDYYSELYIQFDGLDEYDPFSQEYRDALENKKTQAVQAFKDSIQGRYDDLIEQANSSIESAQAEVDSLEDILSWDLEALELMLVRSEKSIEEAQVQYEALGEGNSAQKYLLQSQIIQGENKLVILRELIDARKAGDSGADKKYSAQLEEAKGQIEQSRQVLSSQKNLTFYEFDRFSSTDYSSFKNDSQKINSLSKVFPVFFILIAALVCLTTMTRMVEEQRIQIGTYKALGYSSGKIISKYLIYASIASVLGSCVGTVIGLQIFPYIIYDSYKVMYNIPSIATPFRLDYLLICMAASLVCTGIAVVSSCIKELKAQPSQLMRPKPPAKGKRVVLEKVGFLWKRLDFLAKVTIRNLLRYKKRFLMTILGVAGCTALIITGFGLKYSIKSIVDRQFDIIFNYDAIVVMNPDNVGNDKSPERKLEGFDEVNECLTFTSFDTTGSFKGEKQSVSMVIPEDASRLKDYIQLKDYKTGEVKTFSDDGIIITEKLSKLLGAKVGDCIDFSIKDKEDKSLKITAIVSNYAMHYAYISPKLYEEVYGETLVDSLAYVKIADALDNEAFKEKLVSDEDFLGISFKTESSRGFLDSVESLNSVVLLLIVCAGFLAIVVLYNLANINITERVREIATIKVLGFYDKETSAYIFRENIISAVIGIIIGFGLGKVLHYFVVTTAEVDIVMFNRTLIWWAYLFGALLTMAFTAIVNVVLHYKLKKIDMVESLKSIE